MYIPGRSRTGSRPLSTVMSFAPYATRAVPLVGGKSSPELGCPGSAGAESGGPRARRYGWVGSRHEDRRTSPERACRTRGSRARKSWSDGLFRALTVYHGPVTDPGFPRPGSGRFVALVRPPVARRGGGVGEAFPGAPGGDRDLPDRGFRHALGERGHEGVGEVPELAAPRGIVDADAQRPRSQVQGHAVAAERLPHDLGPCGPHPLEDARRRRAELPADRPEGIAHGTGLVSQRPGRSRCAATRRPRSPRAARPPWSRASASPGGGRRVRPPGARPAR